MKGRLSKEQMLPLTNEDFGSLEKTSEGETQYGQASFIPNFTYSSNSHSTERKLIHSLSSRLMRFQNKEKMRLL